MCMCNNEEFSCAQSLRSADETRETNPFLRGHQSPLTEPKVGRVPGLNLQSTGDGSDIQPITPADSKLPDTPVLKEPSKSSQYVMVERTSNWVRKLAVLKQLPERQPTPKPRERKVIIKSTKLPSVSCDVADVPKPASGSKKLTRKLDMKTDKCQPAPKQKERNVITKSTEMSPISYSGFRPVGDVPRPASGSTLKTDNDFLLRREVVDTFINGCPRYSLPPKPSKNVRPQDLVECQIKRRRQERLQERNKKQKDEERRKRNLEVLKETQLKIVQNNVKRLRQKSEHQKQEEEQQVTFDEQTIQFLEDTDQQVLQVDQQENINAAVTNAGTKSVEDINDTLLNMVQNFRKNFPGIHEFNKDTTVHAEVPTSNCGTFVGNLNDVKGTRHGKRSLVVSDCADSSGAQVDVLDMKAPLERPDIQDTTPSSSQPYNVERQVSPAEENMLEEMKESRLEMKHSERTENDVQQDNKTGAVTGPGTQEGDDIKITLSTMVEDLHEFFREIREFTKDTTVHAEVPTSNCGTFVGNLNDVKGTRHGKRSLVVSDCADSSGAQIDVLDMKAPLKRPDIQDTTPSSSQPYNVERQVSPAATIDVTTGFNDDLEKERLQELAVTNIQAPFTGYQVPKMLKMRGKMDMKLGDSVNPKSVDEYQTRANRTTLTEYEIVSRREARQQILDYQRLDVLDVSSGRTRSEKVQDGNLTQTSNFSDVSMKDSDHNEKLVRIKKSLHMIDELIHEESGIAEDHTDLLNEKFKLLEDRTRADMKLLLVQIREQKEKGQEQSVLELKKKHLSLLHNLERVREENTHEYDKLIKATATRYQALKQQKELMKSYLKSVELEERNLVEGHRLKRPLKDEVHHKSLLSKSLELSEFVPTDLVTEEEEQRTVVNVTDADSSLKNQLNSEKSEEKFSSFEEITGSRPQTDAGIELSDLESRVRGLCEQLHEKRREAEKLWREQQKKKKQRLRIKEDTLLEQIKAYDAYISTTKKALQDQMDCSSDTSFPLEDKEKNSETGDSRLVSTSSGSQPIYTKHVSDESMLREQDNSDVKTNELHFSSDNINTNIQLSEDSQLPINKDHGTVNSSVESAIQSLVSYSTKDFDFMDDEEISEDLEHHSEIVSVIQDEVEEERKSELYSVIQELLTEKPK